VGVTAIYTALIVIPTERRDEESPRSNCPSLKPK
jgi:hypothetical protein